MIISPTHLTNIISLSQNLIRTSADQYFCCCCGQGRAWAMEDRHQACVADIRLELLTIPFMQLVAKCAAGLTHQSRCPQVCGYFSCPHSSSRASTPLLYTNTGAQEEHHGTHWQTPAHTHAHATSRVKMLTHRLKCLPQLKYFSPRLQYCLHSVCTGCCKRDTTKIFPRLSVQQKYAKSVSRYRDNK